MTRPRTTTSDLTWPPMPTPTRADQYAAVNAAIERNAVDATEAELFRAMFEIEATR